MKKISKISVLMLATFALIHTTSCSKDNEPTPSPLNNEKPIDNQGNKDNGNSNQPPTANAQKFEVAEDAVAGDVIGMVEGEDLEENSLTYSLVEDDSELFQVAENGEISLNDGKSLDYETTIGYILTLNVSDGTNKPVAFNVKIKVVNVIETLFEDPASFILKFNLAEGQQLTIGTNASYDYDYNIDWGDGTVEEELTIHNPSHDYVEEGTYAVAIKGAFPAIVMGISDFDSQNALVDVVQWGTQKWQSMASAFSFCVNLESFSATDSPDLSEVTDMSLMFQEASAFNGPIGDWITSNVTNVTSMFDDASSFDQNLGSWNIGSMTKMTSMFDNSGISSTNLALTLMGWNTFVDTNEGPNDITLGIDNLTACGQEVADATQNLAANHQWTFSGNLTIEGDCP